MLPDIAYYCMRGCIKASTHMNMSFGGSVSFLFGLFDLMAGDYSNKETKTHSAKQGISDNYSSLSRFRHLQCKLVYYG